MDLQTDTPGKFETTPIVLDGVLYATGANNLAWALDARTGRVIWRYRRELPDGVMVCCGRVNRGFRILGDTLYLATLDAHLLAMDRKTGAIIWDAVLGDYKSAYSSTSAPLVVKDKVIIGIGGGEYGVRGHRRVRREDCEAGVALSHDPRPGRIWQRDVADP